MKGTQEKFIKKVILKANSIDIGTSWAQTNGCLTKPSYTAKILFQLHHCTKIETVHTNKRQNKNWKVKTRNIISPWVKILAHKNTYISRINEKMWSIQGMYAPGKTSAIAMYGCNNNTGWKQISALSIQSLECRSAEDIGLEELKIRFCCYSNGTPIKKERQKEEKRNTVSSYNLPGSERCKTKQTLSPEQNHPDKLL